ncbi:acyltransferase [Mucilaginibacter xinganensis]|nr:acyltransferase [Mucilaginibacter xinganensis]
MNKIVNYLLNRILGVTKRYSAVLQAGDSKFLPNFSINKNRSTSLQEHKVVIGDKCLLGVSVFLETPEAKVEIGDRVYMGNSSIIAKTGIILGNDIMVAWGVTFYDHDSHSLNYKDRDMDIQQTYADYLSEKGNYLKNKKWDVVNSKPIKIEDHAWIGAESMILKGVTVGVGAIVGARSVVTKDVPPFCIVAGNPAKIVRQLENNL